MKQTMTTTPWRNGRPLPGAPSPDAHTSQQHTRAAVPVFAAGPQASAVLGTNDHTDRFALLQGKAE
jgi:alkaline phosphatase